MIFQWISSLFASDSDTQSSSVFDDTSAGFSESHDDFEINPANGLPMVGGMGGVDIEGNTYGTDDDLHTMGCDSFDSIGDCNMFDDEF